MGAAVDYKSVGANIRKHRKRLGLKQEEFAEKLGLSVSYIGAIERGEKLPKLPVFINIANVLEISSDVLLADVLKVGNEIVASDLSMQIAKLSKEDQRRILNVIDAMLANI